MQISLKGKIVGKYVFNQLGDFFIKLYNKLSASPIFAAFALIAIFSLIMFFPVQKYSNNFYERLSKPLDSANRICTNDITYDTSNVISKSCSEIPYVKARLRQQLITINRRAYHHQVAMKFILTSHYFEAIYMFLMYAITGAIAIIISREGWKTPSLFLVAILAFTTAFGTLFATAPTVFRQKENFDDNKKCYLRYVNLENKICTYYYNMGWREVIKNESSKNSLNYQTNCNGAQVSQPSSSKNNYSQINYQETDHKFIDSIDVAMDELNDVIIGFDASKISPNIFSPSN